MLHAIEIVAAPEPADDPDDEPTPPARGEDYPNVLSARLEKNVLRDYEDRLPDQAQEIDLHPADELSDRPKHIRGWYRFDQSIPKEDLLDAIEEGVVADAKYWVIHRHNCDHDEEKGTGCDDWEFERSDGDVPSALLR